MEIDAVVPESLLLRGIKLGMSVGGTELALDELSLEKG